MVERDIARPPRKKNIYIYIYIYVAVCCDVKQRRAGNETSTLSNPPLPPAKKMRYMLLL